MAIGTLAAIGIGLAGAGAAVSASAQKSAANKASQTAADTAASNNALAQNIYNQNAATLSPFVQRGNAAGGAMNALLGLGGTNSAATQAIPEMQGQQGGAFANYVQSNPDLMAEFSRVGGQFGNDMGAYGQFHWNQYGQNEGRALPNAAQMGQASQTAAEDAFNIFKSSTGYQSRLKEGANAVNSMWAGSGAVKSGAAGKAFERFGQDFASNEFGNYMNYLGNQQGVGLGAASAQAGVGQNYVNTVSNNNNNAGTAAANAALVKGNNSFGNVLGMIGGGMFGYGR